MSEENIITDTMCLNSTKFDWMNATPEDKLEVVRYCTDKLNFRTGNDFDPSGLYKLVDKMFAEAAIDTTTFLEIIDDSYKSCIKNISSQRF
jgi:hypothetical protein